MNIKSLLELLLEGVKTTNQNHPFRRFQIYTGRTWPVASLVYIKASSRAPRFQMNTRILLGIHIDFFSFEKNICTKYSILFGETTYTILAEKKRLPGRVFQAFPCSMDGKAIMTFILPMHGPNIYLDDTSPNQILGKKSEKYKINFNLSGLDRIARIERS